MDPEEPQQFVCSECGEEIDRGLERFTVLGPDEVLCYECALGRGAVYDEVNDKWLVPPDDTEVVVSR